MTGKLALRGRAAIAAAAAFLFFLIKGLAWILVPLLAFRGCS
jgi:hypothetical protein